jgi:hypothetical protein
MNKDCILLSKIKNVHPKSVLSEIASVQPITEVDATHLFKLNVVTDHDPIDDYGVIFHNFAYGWGTYNKTGDWMSIEEFVDMFGIDELKCSDADKKRFYPS